MDPDHELCYCYHVSMRKLVNYARREKLTVPSQMANCLNAGTGCGWCIPFLTRIFETAGSSDELRLDISPEEYAGKRAAYRSEGHPRHEFDDGRGSGE